jgi:hypothetical protein
VKVYVKFRDDGSALSVKRDADGCAEVPDTTAEFLAFVEENCRIEVHEPGTDHPTLWTLEFQDDYD